MATVLYVAPHQDDETLSMGSSIRKHLEAIGPAGQPVHDVHVLLLTAGSGSGAQAATDLDDVAFSRARDDEFVRACRALGVRPESIHFAADRAVGDTELSVAEAQAAIVDFLDEHPGTWIKTYTDLPCEGRHADHVHTGQAVRNLITIGALTPSTVRFYIEPWAISQWRAVNSVTVGSERAASVSRVQRAFDEYGDEDIPGGKYGIGYLSIAAKFRSLRPDPVNYWHAP